MFVRTGQQEAVSEVRSGRSAAATFGDARYQDFVREMQDNGGHAAFDAEPKSTTDKIGAR